MVEESNVSFHDKEELMQATRFLHNNGKYLIESIRPVFTKELEPGLNLNLDLVDFTFVQK